jgi:hypothetical protein
MRRVGRRSVLGALVAQLCDVDTAEKMLARSEHYGSNCNMHLVYESGTQGIRE